MRIKYAIRNKKKGRAKGGMLLAVRKGLGMEINWVERSTNEAIAVSWIKDKES